MNYRLVLKTYTALRQLTDEESALLTTLRNMSESEQELMVETLSPQSKSAKKTGKKSSAGKERCGYIYHSGVACNALFNNTVHVNTNHVDYHSFTLSGKSATKSKRASGMAQAIKNSIGRAQPVQPGCAFIVNNETGEMCMARDDDTIHDPSYLSSHLFVHPDQETQVSGASGGD